MSILSWLGRKIGLLDGEFWRAFYGGETWAGETITPDTAMQVSAFWACTRLLSQTVATLPLGLYERQEDGSRKARSDHPLYQLLHEAPNADSTAVEFWEGMTAALCIAGNAFAEKLRNGQGQVIGLKPLATDWVRVERAPDNNALRYRYTPMLPSRQERVIPEVDMLHIKGFGMGGDVGLSPIAFARQSLSAARAVDRSAATVFANGMRPSGFLLYKGGTLTQEQRDQARKSIIEPMQGPKNTGKVGILEADFDFKQITIPPEDAQMLETRQFNVEDVCRWLGVPPILIGHAATGQTMWGSGVEQIMIGWLTLGLRPYLTRIEQAVKRSLLRPAELAAADRGGALYAEFNVEGLLRADSAGRAALYSSLTQNGIMSRNEVRAKENLPRFESEGGDELTVQVNLQPLSKIMDAPAEPDAGGGSLDQPGADSNVVPIKRGG